MIPIRTLYPREQVSIPNAVLECHFVCSKWADFNHPATANRNKVTVLMIVIAPAQVPHRTAAPLKASYCPGILVPVGKTIPVPLPYAPVLFPVLRPPLTIYAGVGVASSSFSVGEADWVATPVVDDKSLEEPVPPVITN